MKNKTSPHDATTALPVPVEAAAPAAEDAAANPEQDAPDCGADG